jgi:hypothetical protein
LGTNTSSLDPSAFGLRLLCLGISRAGLRPDAHAIMMVHRPFSVLLLYLSSQFWPFCAMFPMPRWRTKRNTRWHYVILIFHRIGCPHLARCGPEPMMGICFWFSIYVLGHFGHTLPYLEVLHRGTPDEGILFQFSMEQDV